VQQRKRLCRELRENNNCKTGKQQRNNKLRENSEKQAFQFLLFRLRLSICFFSSSRTTTDAKPQAEQQDRHSSWLLPNAAWPL
jgi:hypothetical protein